MRRFSSGDAVGNVTPLGLLASEPTKVFLSGTASRRARPASSLAVDFVIYSMSAVSMIVVGLTVLLATVPLSLGVREIVIASLLALGGVVLRGVVAGCRDVEG